MLKLLENFNYGRWCHSAPIGDKLVIPALALKPNKCGDTFHNSRSDKGIYRMAPPGELDFSAAEQYLKLSEGQRSQFDRMLDDWLRIQYPGAQQPAITFALKKMRSALTSRQPKDGQTVESWLQGIARHAMEISWPGKHMADLSSMTRIRFWRAVEQATKRWFRQWEKKANLKRDALIDADDFSQEALLKIFRKLKESKFDPELPFLPYAQKIASSAMITHLKYMLRSKSKEAELPDVEFADRVPATNNFESWIARSFYQTCLNLLSEHERRIIRDFADEIPGEETAEALGINVGNVFVQRGRILKRLGLTFSDNCL